MNKASWITSFWSILSQKYLVLWGSTECICIYNQFKYFRQIRSSVLSSRVVFTVHYEISALTRSIIFQNHFKMDLNRIKTNIFSLVDVEKSDPLNKLTQNNKNTTSSLMNSRQRHFLMQLILKSKTNNINSKTEM